MLNPHLAISLARERERELRQARKSVATPRVLDEPRVRERRRADARFSPRWPLRAASSQLCSETSRVAE
jgi:hypothetical protein